MHLCYLANARLPTEKAHGLQIVENCDALSRAGAKVTLIVPRRLQPGSRPARDVASHYDIEPRFALRRVPCLDLFPLGRWTRPIAARVQLVTFTASALLAAAGTKADVYFSRDVLPLLALSILVPQRRLAYEAHTLSPGRIGAWLQRACVRRTGTVIAVTARLAADLERLGGNRPIVLRDGFRAGRFARLPTRDQACAAAGIPNVAFTVGYLGQLETMGATKGLDAAIPAIAALGDPLIHLCLVGGPRHRAEALHSRWLEAGLSADAFHWLGDLRPSEAVSMLPAFDVSLLTLPPTTHFSYYASPLKLFEYMAAGRAIVATSLPSIAEVLVSGESALLVAPDDRAALANAIAMLRDRPDLRARVGTAARLASREFTWDLRARRIIDALGPAG